MRGDPCKGPPRILPPNPFPGQEMLAGTFRNTAVRREISKQIGRNDSDRYANGRINGGGREFCGVTPRRHSPNRRDGESLGTCRRV